MKILMTAIAVVVAMTGTQAFAAAPEYAMSCEEIISKLNREATPEAKARFADLQGSCMGVVDRDGEMYMHTKIVVRRVRGNTVTLYVPATDRNFDVDVTTTQRVVIGNQRIRARDLSRGQELNIYLAVDQLTQPIIEEVHFETETAEVLSPSPAVVVAALPTTG